MEKHLGGYLYWHFRSESSGQAERDGLTWISLTIDKDQATLGGYGLAYDQRAKHRKSQVYWNEDILGANQVWPGCQGVTCSIRKGALHSPPNLARTGGEIN